MRLILMAFAVSLGLSAVTAFADDAPNPPPAAGAVYDNLQQAPLTEDEIKNYVASLPEMQAAMGDAPSDAAQPDSETMTKLESIARKYGFGDFNHYNTVAGNISLVLDGIDPQSKTYVGAGKLIEKSIAEIQADPDMTAKDKQTALADLQAQLKASPPIRNKGNIDLVLKHYDSLTGEKAAGK